ncbi:hypothetical protein H7X69_00630 [Candidatus Saccharibacteria bacterium]|nr:hypothetical protein [Candidatus Saccharibacteria bacterium]
METSTPTPADEPDAKTQRVTTSLHENKNLLYIVLGLAGILLIGIIILLSVLLTKKDNISPNSNNSSTSKSTTQDSDNAKDSVKAVKTISLKDPNLELLIYEPKINGSNLTVNYSIRNKCKGCENVTYVGNRDANISPGSSYLLDNENGRKYSVITDADKEPLASESCSEYLKAGEKVDCFIAFTKPDPGVNYAIYFGDTGIPVEGFSVSK